METGVVGGVEMAVESARPDPAPDAHAVDLRLLGPLALRRAGVALALPASRKVRALLAYLALADHAVSRSQLCELLWDVPNDPRGELRWCLSKMRGLLDEPGRRRVVTEADTVRLDLADGFVDALEIAGAALEPATLTADRMRELAALWGGDFLEGLEIERSPAFAGWLAAQRRRFRSCRTALLERLAASVADDEAQPHLEKWLELAPFDRRAHERLLGVLARSGRIREGEEHLGAAQRLFEADGLDGAPLRAAWRAARSSTQVTASVTAPAVPPPAREAHAVEATRRASIAVMPFADRSSDADARGGIADALVHDVITRLAKLRVLLVIAQGTVFALDERRIGPQEAGRMLDVDYHVSGSVRCASGRLTVTAELTETRVARIVWAESFSYRLDDTFRVLDELGDRIVASVASEIELSERNRAVLLPPSSLDAWSAHHRGLWHMYRFNRADNELARHFFELAAGLDPTFARAHAGLSFTHWQSAFQGWEPREQATDRAFAAAGQSMMADDRDPAAHWAMGRALWLRGQRDQSMAELTQAVELSPNFALGHYTLAFVHATGGDPATAIAAADQSRRLSPFDPLLFGMLGSRAMALLRLGRFADAADWAVKAAARPNAHAHITAIAVCALALADRLAEARAHLAAIHRQLPHYRIEDLFAAMQLPAEVGERCRAAVQRL